MSTSKALEKLGFDPDNDFDLVDDRDGRGVRLVWKSDQVEPTQQEIDNAENEWQSEYDAQAYARARAAAYAPIADQLDMQYWDSVNGSRTWLDHIESVKDAHPKP